MFAPPNARKIIHAALKIIFLHSRLRYENRWGHPKMSVFYVVLVYGCITFTSSFMWCPLYLTIWWMKWSGSWAANTVRVVPAGTPSSKRIVLGLTGKTGGSFTSWTEMVTPAVDWSEDWMPLARWAWLDTTTVSMKARFISKSTGWRRQRRGGEREGERDNRMMRDGRENERGWLQDWFWLCSNLGDDI